MLLSPFKDVAECALEPPFDIDTAAPALSRESYFTVFVQNEIFGLQVTEAQTIFRISQVTPIPLGPPEIPGLVNLRGKVVTVVSLRGRLGLPGESTLQNALAIGVPKRNESYALVVDRIGGVLSLPAGDRIALPVHLDPCFARYTRALYRPGTALVPILDTDALFDFSAA